MLQLKWVAMALCLMLAFALFLVGCNGNLVPGEDPGSQDPVDNNNNPPTMSRRVSRNLHR